MVWWGLAKDCLVGEIKPGGWEGKSFWDTELSGLFWPIPVGVELGFMWLPDEDGSYKIFPHQLRIEYNEVLFI